MLNHLAHEKGLDVAERVQAPRRHDELVRERGIALTKQLPTLEAIMRVDCHKRRAITRTVRELQALRESREASEVRA